jgi:hypothetical protein
VYTDALKADGVEHPRRRLDDTLGGMAFAFLEKQTFYGNAAERGEVDGFGIFDAIAEAAAGRDQRIGEAQCSNLNGEIRHHSHAISLPLNTGPLRHDRT